MYICLYVIYIVYNLYAYLYTSLSKYIYIFSCAALHGPLWTMQYNLSLFLSLTNTHAADGPPAAAALGLERLDLVFVRFPFRFLPTGCWSCSWTSLSALASCSPLHSQRSTCSAVCRKIKQRHFILTSSPTKHLAHEKLVRMKLNGELSFDKQ